MIYIDPPYNTGNDFIYEDDFAENAEEFLKRSNQKDEEGNRLVANTEANGRFHSDWLSMIYPRLKLSFNLLSDEGVIFISIDENEVSNLRKVCDEIFGEKNALSPFIWSLPRGINAGHVSRAHEYVIGYCRDRSKFPLFNKIGNSEFSIDRCNKKIDRRHPASEITFPQGMRYEGPDKTISGEISGSERIEILGELEFKNGRLQKEVTLRAGWTMRNMILDWLNGKKVYDTKGQEITEFFFKENGKLYSKKLTAFETPKSIISDVQDTQFARIEIEELLGSQGIFSYPKPSTLIERLIRLSTGTNDIVMDFFGGSCATAHSVINTNASTGGARQFILVQIQETIDENNPDNADALDFCNKLELPKTITELGKERIRRAGKKILEELTTENTEKHGKSKNEFSGEADSSVPSEVKNPDIGFLEGLTTESTEKQGKGEDDSFSSSSVNSVPSVVKNLDIGFRVLKVDSSNMADVYYTPDAIEQGQLEVFVDNIKPNRTSEDLLFQVLLDWGVDLSLPIRKESVTTESTEKHGKDKDNLFDSSSVNSVSSVVKKSFEVFFVDDNALIACFDDGITEELVKELARFKPLRVVFCDSRYRSDNDKINVAQIFKQLSPGTEVKAI